MTRFGVVLDACVLVPIAQADTLLRLAEAELYRPLWNSQILYETQKALETIHPYLRSTGKAAQRVRQMSQAFEDSCVEGWEHLLPAIHLPDLDDRHVVATAILGKAELIVTNNLKDFPSDVLGTLEIEVQSPDEFLLNQLDLCPQRVMASLSRQAQATRNPSLEVGDLLRFLDNCGASEFSLAARRQLWRL